MMMDLIYTWVQIIKQAFVGDRWMMGQFKIE
jgi:hypothetical protein